MAQIYRDRTFDWVSRHDERSRQFPIRALIGEVQPQRRIWRPGQILDQGWEGACFTKGVYIRMADGSQRLIEQVHVLDEVATAEGRTGIVTRVIARRYSGPLVRIVAWGHSHLTCTPEHPVLTQRGYVPARELTNTDFIALPRYTPGRATTIDTGALVNLMTLRVKTRQPRQVVHSPPAWSTGKPSVSEITPMPPFLAMTPALGRLLGLYAAEGATTANKVVWAFGSHERDTLVSETVELVKETLGAAARVQVRPNNSVNVILYGKHWRLLFEALVPGTAKHGDKHLSHHVTGGGMAFLEAVLDGWYDGDGYLRVRGDHSSRDGITVSQQLALDMHAIAVAAGRRPTLVSAEPSMNRHAATRQRRWSLTSPVIPLGALDTREGFCLCGCGERLRMTRDVRGRTRRYLADHHAVRQARSRQDDAYLWRKVREVVEQPFDGEFVFNLEVEGDHSYIAEGVGVHNCVGFAWMGEAMASPVRVDLARAELPGSAPGGPWPRDVQALASAVYRQAQRVDEWEGEAYSGSSVLAGAKVLQSLRLLGEYRWAFGVNDVIAAIVAQGPAVLGIPWYDGMYTAPGGLIKPTGSVVGGHAILATGFDPARSVNSMPRRPMVRLTNSWGLSYGDAGSGWITVGDLAMLLDQRGEACVPVSRSYGRVRWPSAIWRAVGRLVRLADRRPTVA